MQWMNQRVPNHAALSRGSGDRWSTRELSSEPPPVLRTPDQLLRVAEHPELRPPTLARAAPSPQRDDHAR